MVAGVLGALLFLAAVDVDAGAVLEVRGGRAPVIPGAQPRAAALSVLTPVVGMELSGHAMVVRLQYAPRLSWVYSKDLHDNRPFVLHNGELSTTIRPGGGAVVIARANAETGEADYTALSQVLGRTQSMLPEITGFTVFAAGLNYTQPVARTWQLEMVFDAVYRKPILSKPRVTIIDPLPPDPDPPPVAPGDAISQQTELSFMPGVSHGVTSRDTLSLRTAFTYAAVSTGLKVISVAPQAGWRHLLTRTDWIRGVVGVAYAPQIAGMRSAENTTLSPIADFAWLSRLYSAHAMTITQTVVAGISWYLDPVIASSGTRGMAGYTLAMAFLPDWSVGAEALFATSLRAKPLPGEPDETIVSGSLPVRYRISRNLFVEFGGRISDRAPHFEAANFEFHQLELWAYGMVGAVIGTNR
jgi:hypothetical protein